MTKLLWHSNSPWAPTGYGNQTRLFAQKFRDHYDEFAISAFYGLDGAPQTWQDIPILPGVGGTVGNEALPMHAEHFFGGDKRGGLVITLMDVWVLHPQVMAQMNMACWVPVDHSPAPQAVVDFFTQSGAVPIAFSRFGYNLLGRLDALYVPHGVDTKTFRPMDQASVRKMAGVPDDVFLIGMVAANKGRPSRKGFVEALQAFRVFRENHENAHLYIHTTADKDYAAGEDILSLIAALGLAKKPGDRFSPVLLSDQYQSMFNPLPLAEMAKVFNTFDVFLNPALGEGFGVPILEAQACGVPGIVTNFSAMPEVCGAGWHVDHRPYWTPQNSWMGQPEVGSIVEALEASYSMSTTERDELSAKARAHALTYDVDVVWEKYWQPALQVIEQRFALRTPVTIKPRELKAAA
jgi:glycosyltransferase involved in cell wall biosynthesis